MKFPKVLTKFNNLKINIEPINLENLKVYLPTNLSFVELDNNFLAIESKAKGQFKTPLYCDYLEPKYLERLHLALSSKSTLIKAIGPSLLKKGNLRF